MSHTELPDPDAARRTISEAVPELGPPIGKQAFALAKEVGRFLDHGQLRRSTKEARNLILDIIGASGTNSSHVGTWYGETWYIIRQFYPYWDPGSSDPGGIDAAFYPALRTLDNKPDLWLFGASHHELRPVVDELHKCLVKLANNLKSSVPRPALLPAQHPPKFALLTEEVVAETVAEQLAELIDKGVRLHEAVQQNTLLALSWESRLNSEFEGALHPFRTTEIRQRYQKATMGFAGVEAMTRRSPSQSKRQAYREIGARVHPQVYSAYTAIAVNYLAEVLELMPDYAEASGQGKRRDPVTVYGNVGAIHSEVNNSHLSVADTVTSIGATINTVADRGETNIADAIRALTEAVQRAPELAEHQRAELLDNVADVADAAAAPDEPRRLSRARAAIAMITTAAGASTQLAQAVNNWHQVAGQLF